VTQNGAKNKREKKHPNNSNPQQLTINVAGIVFVLENKEMRWYFFLSIDLVMCWFRMGLFEFCFSFRKVLQEEGGLLFFDY